MVLWMPHALAMMAPWMFMLVQLLGLQTEFQLVRQPVPECAIAELEVSSAHQQDNQTSRADNMARVGSALLEHSTDAEDAADMAPTSGPLLSPVSQHVADKRTEEASSSFTSVVDNVERVVKSKVAAVMAGEQEIHSHNGGDTDTATGLAQHVTLEAQRVKALLLGLLKRHCVLDVRHVLAMMIIGSLLGTEILFRSQDRRKLRDIKARAYRIPAQSMMDYACTWDDAVGLLNWHGSN